MCRGRRKKKGIGQSDYVIEEEKDYKVCSKSWARLIKKIYEVDPLLCSKCKGSMRIIAFIEDYKVIRKILDWLGIDELLFLFKIHLFGQVFINRGRKPCRKQS
ncbi:MAG: hypothetical protein FJW69_04665 [Actinobacteria bacterium]|nr:hypothetical protein [Actinomycetota bacterium]